MQSGMVLILLIGLLGTESLEGTTDAWHPEVLRILEGRTEVAEVLGGNRC